MASVPLADPIEELTNWIGQARAAGVPSPSSLAFVTVDTDGRPSARTVSLKRVEVGALVFTTALWTRKARDLQANPHIALLFHWPSLGRQVHITGQAVLAERELAEQLFSERDLANRLQTLVSRQGTQITDLEPIRQRHAYLTETMEAPPACPEDWGAIRVHPETVELWIEARDRLHDRWLYQRTDEQWTLTRLAP
jgi:pyridoxamine 5'-phosphate oxidase